jgi:hypothetical protein
LTAVNSFHPFSTLDRVAERRAILTRAATVEAQRQAARELGDGTAVHAFERELRRLWARFAATGRE